jgi:D-sedoheptulose 7-phosphate isomerase
MSEFIDQYLSEVSAVAGGVRREEVQALVDAVVEIRTRGGRLFFLGVGGSAAHASHAVNDFRKLAGLEAYTPLDNVAELTARINDEGWATSLTDWLRCSRLNDKDGVFVFSVGGGDEARNVSPNLVDALRFAREAGARILGVVGRDGGYTSQVADACVVIPTVNPEMVTPHTESFHAVIWHLIVSHPAVQQHPTKWESVR